VLLQAQRPRTWLLAGPQSLVQIRPAQFRLPRREVTRKIQRHQADGPSRGPSMDGHQPWPVCSRSRRASPCYAWRRSPASGCAAASVTVCGRLIREPERGRTSARRRGWKNKGRRTCLQRCQCRDRRSGLPVGGHNGRRLQQALGSGNAQQSKHGRMRGWAIPRPRTIGAASSHLSAIIVENGCRIHMMYKRWPCGAAIGRNRPIRDGGFRRRLGRCPTQCRM